MTDLIYNSVSNLKEKVGRRIHDIHGFSFNDNPQFETKIAQMAEIPQCLQYVISW